MNAVRRAIVAVLLVAPGVVPQAAEAADSYIRIPHQISGSGLLVTNYEFPAISGDGRYVVMVANTSGALRQVVMYDRVSRKVELLSKSYRGGPSAGGSGKSDTTAANYEPAISANGQYVAYTSDANDIVRGDGNGRFDLFVYDMRHRRTKRVALPDTPLGGLQITNDGKYAFVLTSANTRAYHIMRVSTASGSASAVNLGVDNTLADVRRTDFQPDRAFSISADGRYVAFASIRHIMGGLPTDPVRWVTEEYYTSGRVFVRDLVQRRTVDATVGADPKVSYETYFENPLIDDSGTRVVFTHFAQPGESVPATHYVRDLKTGQLTKFRDLGTVPADYADGVNFAISGNGRSVLYGVWTSVVDASGASAYVPVVAEYDTATKATAVRIPFSDCPPPTSEQPGAREYRTLYGSTCGAELMVGASYDGRVLVFQTKKAYVAQDQTGWSAPFDTYIQVRS